MKLIANWFFGAFYIATLIVLGYFLYQKEITLPVFMVGVLISSASVAYIQDRLSAL